MYFARSQFRSVLFAALAVLGTGGCVGGVGDATDDDTSDNPDDRARFNAWEGIRAERQAALDAYLDQNRPAFEAFLHRAVGSNGVPLALLRNFSKVFPDIWGTPEESFGPQGFFADPFQPYAPVPFGLAVTRTSTGLDVAQLTCAGCHTGRVIGPDGKVITLIGAPNTLANQFGTAIEKTVVDPRYLAAFGENALTVGFRDKVLQKIQLSDLTAGAFTYNRQRVPNAPDLRDQASPGFLDALSAGTPILTLPDLFDPAKAALIVVAVLPPAPAQSDIMSVWRQDARTIAQWDGGIVSRLHRNLSAEIGVVSDPAAADFENARLTTELTAGLPSAPYPFDVDLGLANSGKKLFEKYCEGCHHDNNATIFAAAKTGTDPNRAQATQAEARRRLIALLRTACPDPAVCNLPDDEIVLDLDAAGRGYVSHPLDGIWARAPYLHNGSVPTLHHLLVPESRPATFFRGSLRYDQAKVGFVWDDSAAADPYTHVYDSGLAGRANTGHDTAEFNGIDWSQNPRDLAALLEYLKTL